MAVQACILVCVTVQKTCERLIARGVALAQKEQLPLRVVHVSRGHDALLGNPDTADAFNYLYQLAREAGAEMTVLRSENVVETLCAFAREHRAAHLVLGRSRDKGPDVTRALCAALGSVPVTLVE